MTPGWYVTPEYPDRAWYHDGNKWTGWQLRAGMLFLITDSDQGSPAPFAKVSRRLTTGGDITAGDAVRHPTFGLGVVTGTTGHDTRKEALVHFAAGVKHLMVIHARLERIS